jgi:hypothetical protein
VTALATSDDAVVRVLIINKSPDAAARLVIAVRGVEGRRSVRLRELNAENPFERKVAWRKGTSELRDGALRIKAAPHSLTIVEIPQR